MRLLLITIIVVAFATTIDCSQLQPKTDLNDALRDLFEGLRTQMPCGWPQAGIPSLVPLVLDQVEQYIGVEGILDLQFVLDDIQVLDLNRFIVKDISLDLWTLRLDFEITYARIKILADRYMANGRITSTPIVGRTGRFEMDLFDFTIAGFAQFFVISQKQWLDLNDFQATVSVGSARSNLDGLANGRFTNILLNIILENQIPGVFEQNKEAFTIGIRNAVMPMANGQLNFLTINDLLDLIGSEEGIEGGDTCIP